MTNKEAAIVRAYTRVMLGTFSCLHEYAESLLKRTVFTHEFENALFLNRLKELARDDFVNLVVKD